MSHSFKDLPKDYYGLCTTIYLPRPIHNAKQYSAAEKVADAMAGFEGSMSPDQNDYFDVITDFMADYDDAHGPFTPVVAGIDLLREIARENNLTGADISRILGATDRTLGTKILIGTRRITADHARKFGARFRLEPGVFL